MRVLQVHNRYRHPGGEDVVLANEAALLRQMGHDVALCEAVNPDADPQSLWQKFQMGLGVVWSAAGAALVEAALDKFKPDVVHFHNTFSQLSPLAVRRVRGMGFPVVQTVHNYRMTCANGLLMREGRPCTECVDGLRVNGVLHGCYRGSRAGSLAVQLSGWLHEFLGTFTGPGVRLLVLTEFARAVLIRSGVEPASVVVKPNFVFRSGGMGQRSRTIVFVGRLAEEKGVDLLLSAWRQSGLHAEGWSIKFIGDGPLMSSVRKGGHGILPLGWLTSEQVRYHLAESAFLVMGSRSFEGLPMVALEALSVGTPVILPQLGGMGEIVSDSSCGIGFSPGDAVALRDGMLSASSMSESAWQAMSRGAFDRYESMYSPEVNGEQLLSVYRKVISECAR